MCPYNSVIGTVTACIISSVTLVATCSLTAANYLNYFSCIFLLVWGVNKKVVSS